MTFADPLAALADRVAADTGRDRGEVLAIIRRAETLANPTDEDITELVELFTPTVAALMGPTLIHALERLEALSGPGAPPLVAPFIIGLVPAIVGGVALGVEAGRRG